MSSPSVLLSHYFTCAWAGNGNGRDGSCQNISLQSNSVATLGTTDMTRVVTEQAAVKTSSIGSEGRGSAATPNNNASTSPGSRSGRRLARRHPIALHWAFPVRPSTKTNEASPPSVVRRPSSADNVDLDRSGSSGLFATSSQKAHFRPLLSHIPPPAPPKQLIGLIRSWPVVIDRSQCWRKLKKVKHHRSPPARPRPSIHPCLLPSFLPPDRSHSKSSWG